ncbi:MAG: transposase [Rubrivivax sp.]|nr:transposase [Rubrivivax sp.]
MARPHRIEFAQAVYHVTARGDRREPIFLDDQDRLLFVDLLAQALERFDACALAYCLMDNHYHLVLCTRQPNLSALMRHVNGVFTQRVNRRHGKVGHVFQGRYKAILVDRDAYLLEVCRYVDLNPVRAGVVASAQDWPWSSYRALTGARQAPPWLDAATVHGALLGRTPASPAEQQQAARRYADLVATARDAPLWAGALRQQVYLGDDAFVERMQARGTAEVIAPPATPPPLRAVVPPQPRPLSEWLASCSTREEALYRAYHEGGLTMTAMARELGLSVARVSQLVQRAVGVTVGVRSQLGSGLKV